MTDIVHKKEKTLPTVLALLVMYFNKKVRPLYHPDQGRDMLIIAIVFEVIRLAITLYRSNLEYQNILSTGITAVVLLGMAFFGYKVFTDQIKGYRIKQHTVLEQI